MERQRECIEGNRSFLAVPAVTTVDGSLFSALLCYVMFVCVSAAYTCYHMSYRTFDSIEFSNPFNAVENQLKHTNELFVIYFFLLCHTAHTHTRHVFVFTHSKSAREGGSARISLIPFGPVQMKYQKSICWTFSNIAYVGCFFRFRSPEQSFGELLELFDRQKRCH